MKTLFLILLAIPTISFSQDVSSPELLTKMLKGAERNIMAFCGKDKVIEFTRSPEAHDTYIRVSAEGRTRTMFAPKLTGLAVCRATEGVTLIQWTAHSAIGMDGELKFTGVTKSFFLSKKISLAGASI
jgi:phage FluMu protein Com